jgi:hypothetical protein
MDLLESLPGRWRGTVQTWLDPAAPPLVNEAEGTFRRLLDGGSVVYEYTSRVGEHRADGMAILGIDIATMRPCMTWVDTFHTGANVMQFAAEDRELANGLSFGGAYAAGDQTWRWRVSIVVVSANEIRVDHINITPDGEEAPAIRIDYQRMS